MELPHCDSRHNAHVGSIAYAGPQHKAVLASAPHTGRPHHGMLKTAEVAVARPAAVNRIDFGPVVLHWRSVNVATPATAATVNVPPMALAPDASDAVTLSVAPTITLPPTSVTLSTGCVVKAIPAPDVVAGSVVTTSLNATPTPSVNAPDAIDVSAGAVEVKVSRYPATAGPSMRNPLNVAVPNASVAAVMLNVPVGDPDETTAVTSTPPVITSLPPTSRNWTTGCVVSTSPFTAPAGCVTMAIVAAAPTAGEIPGASTLVRPLLAKRST